MLELELELLPYLGIWGPIILAVSQGLEEACSIFWTFYFLTTVTHIKVENL